MQQNVLQLIYMACLCIVIHHYVGVSILGIKYIHIKCNETYRLFLQISIAFLCSIMSFKVANFSHFAHIYCL